MSKPTKVPGIPKPPASVDRNTAGLLTNLIEAVEIRLGRRGDPKDRAVTLRELVDSGLVKDLKAAPWDPNNPNSTNRGFGPNEVIDTSKPPAPQNFQANAAYSQVNLSWDYPNYSNHSFAEIYGHDSDTIGDAQLIGVSSGRAYADPIGSGASRYYWIRFVSQSNIIGPFNSGTGTLATTAADVDHLLGVLTDAITESELATDLQTEIDKISGDITVAGSVAAQVAAEATARATAVSNEAAARATAVSGEASARATALSDEATARATAITSSANALQAQLNDLTGIAAWDSTESYSIDDKVRHDDKLWSADAANSDSEPTYSDGASTNSDWELTGDYTSLASVTADNSAAITEINNVSSDSTSAAAVAIKGLQTTVADPTTGLSATAGALTTLSNAVNHTDTGLAATANNLTSLETAVFNDMTGVSDWSSSATYAIGDKVISGKKLYRASDASTDEEPPNSSYWVVDTLSSASAVSDLSTTLTDDYATAADTNLLLAGKETAGAAATALSDAQAYADNNFATSSALTAVETAVFNDMTGVADWNDSTAYEIGDKVISGKKLYRAIAASTDGVPPNSTYWELDTLSSASAISELSTTLTDDYATAEATGLLLADKEDSGAAAQALTDAQAYADNNFATSSQLTNLESATFGNLTGLSAYDADTTYAVGDRVTHGTGDAKKIYIATDASSASDQQAPTVPEYWDEDTIASQAVTNAALGGKETSGAAAQALQDAKTYADDNSASATEFSDLNAAVFEDVAGVDAWDSATAYAIGARVYFGRKIYRAKATSTDVEPGTDTTKWLTDPAAAASALTALDTKVNDDYTTSSDLTDLLAFKISATQSATNIAQAIENSETTAGNTYATAANLNSLESSIFADLINVSAWVGTSEGVTAVDYVAGNFVTHDGKLFKALAASTNVEPGTDAAKWEQDTLTTADQVESAYAKSSDVSVLQSNIFNSMTGVADWSATPTYAVGDRVVYTETNGVKKLYKALIANSDTTPHDNISGSTPTWSLDTLASALTVSALDTKVTNDYSTTATLTGQFSAKENAGTAAGLLESYTTTANQNTATATAVDAAYAAIFTEMTGLPDWDTTTTYAVGDRVVHRETSTANRKVYKALIANFNLTPHNNITGSNPRWELDTLAFAGALSTLDTTVNANGTGLVDKTDAIELRIDNVGDVTMEQKFTAQATDIGDLESQYTVKIDSNGHVAGFGLANTTTASGSNTSEFYVNADRFAITPDLTSAAPAFAVGNSYSTGDFVTHNGKVWMFKLVNTSTNQAASNYTVNHANLGPGGSSGSAALLWEEAGHSPFVIEANNIPATFDTDGNLLTPFIPRGVYMNTARIKHADITSAQIGSVNADTISSGSLNVTGLIETNAIEASKLSIDNNFLAENSSGELMLKTVSSNDGSGVKYENLSFDAVGVIAQGLQSGNLTMNNQSYNPSFFTSATPWSTYVQLDQYGAIQATHTLSELLPNGLNIPASSLKESGTYFIDFGAQPFGSLSNNSSTSASMIVLDILRKAPSSSTYTYVTSRRGTSTRNGSLPLTYRNGAADVYLDQSFDYKIKLFGHIKGFSDHASSSSKGMYGGFIRVFKIHKST